MSVVSLLSISSYLPIYIYKICVWVHVFVFVWPHALVFLHPWCRICKLAHGNDVLFQLVMSLLFYAVAWIHLWRLTILSFKVLSISVDVRAFLVLNQFPANPILIFFCSTIDSISVSTPGREILHPASIRKRLHTNLASHWAELWPRGRVSTNVLLFVAHPKVTCLSTSPRVPNILTTKVSSMSCVQFHYFFIHNYNTFNWTIIVCDI